MILGSVERRVVRRVEREREAERKFKKGYEKERNHLGDRETKRRNAVGIDKIPNEAWNGGEKK